MAVLATEIPTQQPAESIMRYVDMVNDLRWNADGSLAETISSITSLVFTGPSGTVTLASQAINTAEEVRKTPRKGTNNYYDPMIIPIGAGIKVRISGGTNGVRYRGEILYVTTGGDTKEIDVDLQIED